MTDSQTMQTSDMLLKAYIKTMAQSSLTDRDETNPMEIDAGSGPLSIINQTGGARRRRRGRKSKRSKKLRRSNKSRLSNKSKKSRSRSASRSKVKVSRKSLRKSKKRSKKSLK